MEATHDKQSFSFFGCAGFRDKCSFNVILFTFVAIVTEHFRSGPVIQGTFETEALRGMVTLRIKYTTCLKRLWELFLREFLNVDARR